MAGLRDPQHDESDEGACGCSYLGVAHGAVEVELGVDADELDEKAADPGEHEVEAGQPAHRTGVLAQLPENPEDDEREEQFVDGGWLNKGGRRVWRDERILRHVNAPRQRGVDAVVAIAREQTADAADSVADGRGRGGEIEHADCSDTGAQRTLQRPLEARAVALAHEYENADQHPTEPGEAVAEPAQEAHDNVHGMMPSWPGDDVQRERQLGHVLQLVPHLGADDSCDHYRSEERRVGKE